MRRVLISSLLFSCLLLAPGAARAQFNAFSAVGMLGEAVGNRISRRQARREKRRRQKQLVEEVRATLEAMAEGSPELILKATEHLANLAEEARQGAVVFEDPKAVAVAFLGQLDAGPWKIRWHACRGLVGLGYTPAQIQGWMQGTVELAAPRLARAPRPSGERRRRR